MGIRVIGFRAVATAALLLAPVSTGAAICKWVDDNGVTHYAEHCPDDVGASEIDMELTPDPVEWTGLLDPVHVRPALYYDLPECIAAKKARRESGRP